MECTCRDDIICDACAAAKLAQTILPSTDFTLTHEQVETLTNEVTAFLNTLKVEV